jgi:DNA-binding Lrp family transcriptional regulator
MTSEEKILKILRKSKEMRLHDLVDAVGASRQMVHRAVKRLLEKGVVHKLGAAPKTHYRLSENRKTVGRKPVFDRRIFWDVDFDNLDYNCKANFVIVRVFERGDVDDIRNCRRYYGDEKVTQALLNAKFLPLHTMYLASAVTGKSLSEFRCYTLRQSNPALFPY